MESIRGTALLELDGLLTEHGATGRDYLRPLGIAPEVAGNFNQTLPYSSLVKLFEGCAQGLSLPRFGLELALRQGSTLIGPLRHLALSAPTVEHALVSVIRYMRLYCPAIQYRLDNRAGRGHLYFSNGMNQAEQTPQIVEKCIMAALLLVGELRGVPMRPLAVTLRHAAIGEPAGYHRYFNCPVLFMQPHNCLVIPGDVLHEPSIGHDAALHAIVRFFLEDQGAGAEGLQAQVMHKIQMLLPQQRCTLDQVALALGFNPRTLQRRLANEGIDFENYLDGIRREQATQMLLKTNLGVAQIACELGYRRTTSFCRAHQRWFGMSPLEHRQQQGDSSIHWT